MDENDDFKSDSAHSKKTEQRKRRAEKAKQDRLKRKRYIESLEQQKSFLKMRISQFENKSDKSDILIKKMHLEKQQKLKKEMFEHLQKPIVEEAILKDYINLFKMNSRSRQKLAEYFLSKVGDSIVPERLEKMALWVFALQNDAFFESKDGDFQRTLSKEVRVAPPEIEKLTEFRNRARAVCLSLENCQKTLKSIQQEIGDCLKTRYEHVDHISKYFSAKEIAKFCKWVDDNSNLILMVDAIWDFNKRNRLYVRSQKNSL